MTMTPGRIRQTDNTIDTAVGGEIRAWMGRRGYRQRHLAELLQLSQASISAKLAGKTPFMIGELAEIASWLDITLGELLGSEVINTKRSRTQDEYGTFDNVLPRLDSNQQPFD